MKRWELEIMSVVGRRRGVRLTAITEANSLLDGFRHGHGCRLDEGGIVTSTNLKGEQFQGCPPALTVLDVCLGVGPQTLQ